MLQPPATAPPQPGFRRHASRRYLRHGLLLLLLAGTLLQSAWSSELNRLALAVSHAPPSVRADFATTAIYETASAYAEEAQRARQEGNQAQRRELRRWAQAVDSYATDLWTLVDRIDVFTSIDIRINAASEVELGIDGSAVLVNGPKPQLRTAFEQAILEHFCALQPCTELLADYRPPQAATAIPTGALRWTFSERSGPVCSSDDGLEFQFRDTRGLSHKRQACEQVIAELTDLATRIGNHTAHGIRVDWNHLRIHALKDRAQQRVELNSDGDSLLMSAPTLVRAERLFVLVKPWLAARVKGTVLRQVVINTDTLMAPLLPPS